MSRLQWSPTVVVGIDFGMTCTGIAYSSEDSHWGEPQVIQYWPGCSFPMNKCPSQVAYTSDGLLIDWGCCTRAANIATSARYFKSALDPSFYEPTLSHKDATKFYIDYMSEINKYLDEKLGQLFYRWYERPVEYRFSLPTTWPSPRLTAQLKQCLAQAGFTSKGNRRVVFTRTEAEAAAVYAADAAQAGEVLMVIDAGGATTDINMLKITEKTGQLVQMVALDKAEGISIGSIHIDQAAHELVTRKLEALGLGDSEERDSLAYRMMQTSSFDMWKSDYGRTDTRDALIFEVPSHKQQHVILSSSELTKIFEILITKLMRFIRYRIDSLAETHPRELLRYIVLSGDLGSSMYLRQRLVAELCTGNRHPVNSWGLEVVQVERPQLSVAQGLVKDRPISEYPLLSSLSARRARASYGVLTRAPYNPKLHFGQPTYKDERTGKLWVEQRINWFLKEGDTICEDGYRIEQMLRVSKERRLDTLRCTIVTSELSVSTLPLSMVRGPVSVLCNVYGRFEPSDFDAQYLQRDKGGLFSKTKDSGIAKFYFKIKVGSATLDFEIEAPDGQKYNERLPNIEVIWEDGGPLIQAY